MCCAVINTLDCYPCEPESVQGADRVVVTSPRSVDFSGFLHHVLSQNDNIRTFQNASVSSLSFLCNQNQRLKQHDKISEFNSTILFLNRFGSKGGSICAHASVFIQFCLVNTFKPNKYKNVFIYFNKDV